MEGARARGAQRLGTARTAGRARRGAGAQQVPGEGGRVGQGVGAEQGRRPQKSASGPDGFRSYPRRGRRTGPLGGSGAPSARPRAPTRACDPSAIATRAGAFSPRRLETGPGPRAPPLRTSGKNLRADGSGEWKDAGGRQGMWGQVELGRGVDPRT